MRYRLAALDPQACHLAPTNPRTDGATADLPALAEALGPTGQWLVQPPIVCPDAAGGYRVLCGERRIRALQQQGATAVPMLILDDPAVTASDRHRLQLLENLHRLPLHPIDWAVGLRIQHLAANAAALDLAAPAATILEAHPTPLAQARALEAWLKDQGWNKYQPPVPLEATLASLGVTQSRATVMKQLRVLTFDLAVIERLQALPITEAAIRAFSTLSTPDQETLLTAVEADATLLPKLRAIVNRIGPTCSLAASIAIAQGRVLDADTGMEDPSGGPMHEAPLAAHAEAPAPPTLDDLTAAVQQGEQVLDALDLLTSLAALLPSLLPVAALPEPWAGVLAQALAPVHRLLCEDTHVV